MELPKSFDDLIEQSKLPVLVDFWADWCGPCRTVAPVIEQIAREYKGKIVVVKVDVDRKQHVAARYRVQSIPTIMLFYRGETLARQSGALPYGALKQLVDEGLAKSAAA